MSFWNKTADEVAIRESNKRQEEEWRRAEEFARTPAGQARAAHKAGQKLFQLSLTLGATAGAVIAVFGGSTSTSTLGSPAATLDSIEAEGWRLEQAGYVCRIVGSVSREKWLSSGVQEAVSSEIVGIYVFRRIAVAAGGSTTPSPS
jgi:hypothetical protein